VVAQYWITFGLMAFSGLSFAVMTFTRPLNKRSHGCTVSDILAYNT
jgi:hypothetical protein